VKDDRIERIVRRFTEVPRRKAIAVLLSALPFSLLAVPPDVDAGRRKKHKNTRNGAPGLINHCSKLGGKCAFNGDCCGPGTRCRKFGNGKCRCKVNRAACAGICCRPGQACCGRCADLQTDAGNCGACFTNCGEDETCVAGVCTS
jgi:hypothetical protein